MTAAEGCFCMFWFNLLNTMPCLSLGGACGTPSTPGIQPETSSAKSVSCSSWEWRGRSVCCTTNKPEGPMAETAPLRYPAMEWQLLWCKFKKQNASRRNHNYSHKQAECIWKQGRSRKWRLPLHQPTHAGGRREPGTEKLKIMSRESLKFIIQI